MTKYSVAERVKIVEAYYENGRSIQKAHRALRNFFGDNDTPTDRTILNLVHKFKETGSILSIKPSVRVRTGRSDANIAAVLESVAQNPNTSTRNRARELNLSRTTLRRILSKDLSMHAYQIQTKQEMSKEIHTAVDQLRTEKNKAHKQHSQVTNNTTDDAHISHKSELFNGV